MQGCPMRCKYCHNPDTWAINGGKEYTAEQVAKNALRYKNYFANGGGVTVSGGEPLLQIAFVKELFKILKENGIHTALDTSGVVYTEDKKSEIDELLSYTDLVLLDIKHINSEEHKALTAWDNKNVLAFAKHLSEMGKPVWIRHVLVPQLTDNDEYLKELSAFINSLKNVERVEVLPYHTMGVVKYEKLGLSYPLQGVQPPTAERVREAKQILCIR